MTGFSQRGRQTTGTVKTATGGRTTIHTNFGIWQELFDDNNSPTRPVGISPSLISFQQPDETSEGQLVTIRNNTNQRMTCVWNSYTQSPTGKLPKCAQNSPFIVTPTTSDCDAHSTTSFRIKFLSLPTEGYTNQKGVIMKRWYEDEIFLNALNESPEEIRRTSGRSLSDQLFLSKRPTRQSEVRLN
ncbi:hypothetical protein BLNAU_12719 [Blattamonas nauphoetae]|uniref:Major sperm protein n=1 Tax=Blattamonas nauphoetae TaxID=2049346 RepID=A0ABQ9XLF6_9EUKA|nr:hypothetical protein BLNAU_12719 [Blattamonas nauphoetae]